MPPPFGDDAVSVVGSDGEAAPRDSQESLDIAPNDQLNSELQDDVVNASEEAARVQDEGGEEDDEEEEFDVEAIRSHMIHGRTVLYEIKWQGYPEDQNTFEPEKNLLPHAKMMLTKYHQKIGGPPDKTLTKSKSTQPLQRQSSAEESRAPKRQKRTASKGARAPEELGTWVPAKEDWESFIVKVDTVERSESGQLMAYIDFKNGKKTKVSMDKVYRHCPRAMLKFYEGHLKFK
ncbi:uncharacterized protein Z518_04037 [Rhinocladiella mackenziei CBS 650.93]|uniref:Chromo domain-containing protein n=1 Tax=Rhinocladiella mackenziei CBS 650.93 TaxID=1442369 RepID=A0A0D2H6P8_9EURO|nr:uncharacterized protein Z518_04037 [Rhinocladiella mackenziei CBS 650.93]KIX06063.1 hypothetical protein Z518_04037 [Rhinocladiella mackenziei CBS 650.93]